MNKMQFIAIDQLSFEPEIQIRVKINEETVAHYASCMESEDDLKKFPPVIVFYDGSRYWLADGHHRRAGAIKVGHAKIWAVIRNGNVNDAIWEAIVSNGKQGLSLSKEDRKRAITIAITKWPEKSTTIIAEAIGCHQSTVSRIKNELMQLHKLKVPAKTTGKDGKQRSSQKKKPKSVSVPKTQSPKQESIESEEVTPDHNGYVPPPLIHKPGGFVPTVTLQHIPQDEPERLIGCVFSLFSEEFILQYIPGLMERLTRNENGLEKVQTLLSQLNKKYNKKPRK